MDALLQQRRKREDLPQIPDLKNPPKQDHRSFVQNMFGTIAFQLFEWLTPVNLDVATTIAVQPHEASACSGPSPIIKDPQAVADEAEEDVISASSHTNTGHGSRLCRSSKEDIAPPEVLSDNSMAGRAWPHQPVSHDEAQSTEASEENSQKSAMQSTVKSIANQNPVQEIPIDPIDSPSQVPDPVPGHIPATVSTLPQTLSRLSPDIIVALYESAGGKDDELLYSEIQRNPLPPYQTIYPRTGLFRTDDLLGVKSITPRGLLPQWKTFVEQSIFYVMSDPLRLLHSLSPLDYVDELTRREGPNNSLHSSLELLLKLDSSAVLHSLWISGGMLSLGVNCGEEYTRLSSQHVRNSLSAYAASASLSSLSEHTLTQPPLPAASYLNRGLPLRSSTATPSRHTPLPDAGLLNGRESVDLQVVIFQALIAYLSPEPQLEDRAKIDVYHSQGMFWSNGKLHEQLSDEYALRLARRLFSGLVNHDVTSQAQKILTHLYTNFCYNHQRSSTIYSRSDVTWMAFALMQWAKAIIIRDWDGQPEITSTAVDGALQMLAALHDVNQMQRNGGDGKFWSDMASFRDHNFRNVSHWYLYSYRLALTVHKRTLLLSRGLC